MKLEIRKSRRRQRGAKGVQYRQNIDDLLGDSSFHRQQKPGSRETHARQTEGHAADCALEGDGPHPPANVKQFIHFGQRRVHNHGPGGFGGDVAVLSQSYPNRCGPECRRVINSVAEDETNSLTKTVLLMHIGGGNAGPGIHGAHLGPGVAIRYGADESRQNISWVESNNTVTHRTTLYVAAETKSEAVNRTAGRVMDCVDCHNRPTHAFEVPERAVDHSLASGELSNSLPFIKKKAVELLKQNYASQEDAAARIPASLAQFYQQTFPALFGEHQAEISRAAQGLIAIYRRNVFPQMKVSWGTYPNNIGHTDFPGCFRCHDNQHTSSDAKLIPQDCDTCHNLLAMEDPAPKILTDLGVAPGDSGARH